jgi:hypothetical protein
MIRRKNRDAWATLQAVIGGLANVALKIDFVEPAADARFGSVEQWIKNAKLPGYLEPG